MSGTVPQCGASPRRNGNPDLGCNLKLQTGDFSPIAYAGSLGPAIKVQGRTVEDLIGPAFLSGAGFDIARFQHATIGFEGSSLLLLNREGAVATAMLALDFSVF